MQAHAKPLPKYVSPKGMWTSKLVLRATSVVFTIIVAALGGSIASNPKLDEYDVMLIIMLPGVCRQPFMFAEFPRLCPTDLLSLIHI